MPVPRWYGLRDCAEHFLCSVPELLYAQRYGEADWYVRRWEAVREVELECLHAALARPTPAPTDPDRPVPPGWHGGPCVPPPPGVLRGLDVEAGV